jgi:hypothetical protein
MAELQIDAMTPVLPVEIWQQVFHKCDTITLKNASTSCKLFQSILNASQFDASMFRIPSAAYSLKGTRLSAHLTAPELAQVVWHPLLTCPAEKGGLSYLHRRHAHPIPYLARLLQQDPRVFQDSAFWPPLSTIHFGYEFPEPCEGSASADGAAFTVGDILKEALEGLPLNYPLMTPAPLTFCPILMGFELWTDFSAGVLRLKMMWQHCDGSRSSHRTYWFGKCQPCRQEELDRFGTFNGWQVMGRTAPAEKCMIRRAFAKTSASLKRLLRKESRST